MSFHLRLYPHGFQVHLDRLSGAPCGTVGETVPAHPTDLPDSLLTSSKTLGGTSSNPCSPSLGGSYRHIWVSTWSQRDWSRLGPWLVEIKHIKISLLFPSVFKRIEKKLGFLTASPCVSITVSTVARSLFTWTRQHLCCPCCPLPIDRPSSEHEPTLPCLPLPHPVPLSDRRLGKKTLGPPLGRSRPGGGRSHSQLSLCYQKTR